MHLQYAVYAHGTERKFGDGSDTSSRMALDLGRGRGLRMASRLLVVLESTLALTPRSRYLVAQGYCGCMHFVGSYLATSSKFSHGSSL